MTDEAIKHDKDKLRMDLIPPIFSEWTAEALGYGAKKYNDYNYKNGKGLTWMQISAALDRHHTAWKKREDFDAESTLHHLKHASACMAMLVVLVANNIGEDNRYKR